MNQQPWIGKPATDLLFILLPPFASLGLVFLFPDVFQNNASMPEAGWVALVLLVDVAHVYSTLYRTYFDPQALQQQRFLLWVIPFCCFLAGVLVYTLSSLWFWRILAYVAVFHFVRQQYGFMRVYSRKEPKTGWAPMLDKLTIYAAALYPLLHWHLSGPRNFNWFVAGDFLFFSVPWLLPLATGVYLLLLALYAGKEVYLFWVKKQANLPRLALVTGTALSWYFGIVYFNGDMAFTLLNVVSHGVPYMALVWLYGKKQYSRPGRGSRLLRLVFGRYGVVLFLLLLFLFAFIEEGLWDVAVWQEHKNIFGTAQLPSLWLSHQALSFIVPFLALPQLTHYVLDGFIWKIKEDGFKWRTTGSQEARHP